MSSIILPIVLTPSHIGISRPLWHSHPGGSGAFRVLADLARGIMRANQSDAIRSRDRAMKLDRAKIESLIRPLLIEIGEDPAREGLVRTPKRVAEAIEFLTSGNRVDLERLINGAVFTQETNSMVIVKNIEVYSLCEHHMLPFFGRCHIGYIPSGQVFRLSN